MSVFSESAKERKFTPAGASCLGKVAFDSFRLANAVLGRQKNKARPARSAYLCGHCQLWHLGTDSAHAAKARLASDKSRKFND
jgi:hypothetical protein